VPTAQLCCSHPPPSILLPSQHTRENPTSLLSLPPFCSSSSLITYSGPAILFRPSFLVLSYIHICPCNAIPGVPGTKITESTTAPQHQKSRAGFGSFDFADRSPASRRSRSWCCLGITANAGQSVSSLSAHYITYPSIVPALPPSVLVRLLWRVSPCPTPGTYYFLHYLQR